MPSILTRVATGDPAAVDECLTHYGGLVWSLARRYSCSAQEAEDATQEIFLDLWQNANRFDSSIASETTFVAMIARRRLIDLHRKRCRSMPTTSLPRELELPAGEDRKSTHLDEEITLAREQMARLKPAERDVLTMAIDQGLSTSQIADALQMPLGTVKTNARRGILQLREWLAGHSRENVVEGTR